MQIAQSVFEKFGGIRPMADKLGIPSSTVKSWHVKRAIPRWWHKGVLDAAADHRLQVTLDEVEAIRPDSAPLSRGAPPREQARAA